MAKRAARISRIYHPEYGWLPFYEFHEIHIALHGGLPFHELHEIHIVLHLIVSMCLQKSLLCRISTSRHLPSTSLVPSSNPVLGINLTQTSISSGTQYVKTILSSSSRNFEVRRRPCNCVQIPFKHIIDSNHTVNGKQSLIFPS